MKNEYNKKKRITIITLSALAVCLAAGLFWYMGTLGNTQPPAAQFITQPPDFSGGSIFFFPICPDFVREGVFYHLPADCVRNGGRGKWVFHP